MSWNYIRLKEVGPLTARYEQAFSQKLDEADDDDTSQAILNEISEWDDFVTSVSMFEDMKRDPASFVDPWKRTVNLYTVKKTPFNLTYERVQTSESDDDGTAAKGTATPILLFRDGERESKLRQAFIDLSNLL